MPVMDGYAATRALRQLPGLQSLPVIAMTANTMVGDRERALAAGMNDHIAKPIRVDDMFATLARWVRPTAADAPTEFADLPGIDARAGLTAMMGNDVLYRRLLCMFRDGHADFAARFRAARSGGDAATAMRLAHDLKSVTATLGVVAVHQEAAALELACIEGSDDVDERAEAVTQRLLPVVQGLQSLGGSRTP